MALQLEVNNGLLLRQLQLKGKTHTACVIAGKNNMWHPEVCVSLVRRIDL